MEDHKLLKVAIIGSGNLGTDLLFKVLRSPFLDCVLFVGRSANSKGLQRARNLGVSISSDSIRAIEDQKDQIDLVFDCTSASQHRIHAPIFAKYNIKAIDLTPAKLGEFCIPSINLDAILQANNINMVTCGGQSSIPIIHSLSEVCPDIKHVNLISYLAEDSVGQGTIDNIDEYYSTTAEAITQFSGVASVEVNLELEKSNWKPDMLTVLQFYVDHIDLATCFERLQARLQQIQRYVPGYRIVGTPSYDDGVFKVTVSVSGQGDWLPVHAGNLDIINCAALAAAEHYAQSLGIKRLDRRKSERVQAAEEKKSRKSSIFRWL